MRTSTLAARGWLLGIAVTVAALAAPVPVNAGTRQLSLLLHVAFVAEIGMPTSVAGPQAFGASGSLVYSLAGGSLPAGTTLDGASGEITGRPQAAGTYRLLVRARDSAGSVAKRRYVFIVVKPPACAANQPVVGEVGTFVKLATCTPFFARSNVYLPARFALISGTLPPGVSLIGDGSTTMEVAGTPMASGTYTFTVTATDLFGGRTSVTTGLTVYPELTLSASSLPAGVMGAPYSANVHGSGGDPPYTYSGFLGGGLTLNGSTGLLSGTIASTGTWGVFAGCGAGISVTDAAGFTTFAEVNIHVPGEGTASCAAMAGPAVPFVSEITRAKGPAPTLPSVPTLLEAAPVTIRGYTFGKVTSVTFNGLAAAFKIESDKVLVAIPPVGATSGPIVLTNSAGSSTAGTYIVTTPTRLPAR